MKIDSKHFRLILFLVLISQIALGQDREVTGTVTDASNIPLPGVNITIQGSDRGTQTNFDGEYSITAHESDTLIFSFVGMDDYSEAVGGSNVINVAMQEGTASKLEEVVIVGFGQEKKENLTGSVSSVSTEDITNRASISPSSRLQGQIPGLRIVQSTGQPGADGESTIQIRGQGTYSDAGSNPLVLIDGIEGELNTLNPYDIKNISVLKDAASASIYGSKAANGVIMITTKDGNKGEFIVEYNGLFSRHAPTKMLDLVTNSADYMRLFNEAKENSGIASSSNTYPNDMIDQYANATDQEQFPNFDWPRYMYRPVFVQQHNLAISGGEEKTTYRISLGYADQPGTMRGFDFEKYNFRSNIKSEVKDGLTIGANVGMFHSVSKEPRQGQADAFLATLSQPPTYSPWLPGDKNKPSYKAFQFESNNKNMDAINKNDVSLRDKQYDLSAQVWTDINLFDDLEWYSKFGIRYFSENTKDWRPHVTLYDFFTGDPAQQLDVGPEGLTDENDYFLYNNFYSYLKYNFGFLPKQHELSIQVGYSQEEQKFRMLSGERERFASNLLKELNAGEKAIQKNEGTSYEWALQSVFGRLQYAFDSKYLFEANLRYDGTSRIASSGRWGWFPSFSTGWNFSRENFIKEANIDWLSSGKIRGSYGLLGNQNIGNYPYQALLSYTGDYPFDNSSLSPGIAITDLNNRNIKWEKTSIADIGIDLQLFNNKLTIAYDWYRKRTKDILREAQISSMVGLEPPTVNSGDMINTGHEIFLQFQNSVNSGSLRGLQYGLGANVNIFKNKLSNFGSREINTITIRQNGSPYNSFYVLQMDGIFQNQEEIDNSPKQFDDDTQPGDIKYKDTNGDGVIDENDRTIIPGRFPKFEYSFNGNLSWKNIDFYVMFQGVEGRKVFGDGWSIDPFRQGTPPTKDFADNYWKGEGSTNSTPRITYDQDGNSQNRRESTYYLHNASYLRLKNITLGYTIPENIVSKIGLKDARIYVSGENLITWTSFKGLDPERGDIENEDSVVDRSFAQYPQNKTFSLGVDLKF